MNIKRKNYFDLFGLEVGIEVNQTILEQKYKELQK